LKADRRFVSGPSSTQYANPPSPRILSKFCAKHSCEFFYEQDGCSFKKPVYDTVCAVHARCPVAGCTNCKGQYVDPQPDPRGDLKYLRHPYCAEHKCTVSECQTKRTQAHPGGPYASYCPQHRCSVEGCTAKRIDQRNFCAKHKCKSPECQMVVEDTFDLCSRHIVCEVRGCNKTRQMLSKENELSPKDAQEYGVNEYGEKQYLPYCPEHGACLTPACTGFGTPTSRHCPGHTCPERECKDSSGDHQYCDLHRCETQGCESPRAWKKNRKDREKRCPLHICRKKDCLGPVATMGLFCIKHECSNPGCVLETIAEDQCLNHLKLLYQNDGKVKAKAEMEDWVRLSSRSEEVMFPHDSASSQR